MKPSSTWREILASYQYLLASHRGKRTYVYIFLHGAFHSGIYTWLGLYFNQNYQWGTNKIGLAMSGYGLVGTFLAPLSGKTADSWGRYRILVVGLALTSLVSAILIFPVPYPVAILATLALALSYGMTQPLLTGIVNDLDSQRRGQAIGINVFLLFVSFGLGGFLFGEILRLGFPVAFLFFTVLMSFATIIASILFGSEDKLESRSRNGN